MASLLWLKPNEKSEDKFDFCGTIMDYLVSVYSTNYIEYISADMASDWRLVY